MERTSYFVLPAGIILPYYARHDLAFQESISFTGFSEATPYVVGADLEIPISFNFTLASGATVGNRLVGVTLNSPDATNISVSVYASGTQPASTIYIYRFVRDIANAYGTSGLANPGGVNGSFITPLPSLLLYPGHIVNANVFSPAADNTFSAVTYTRILIPTGPDVSYESEAHSLHPTPLIV